MKRPLIFLFAVALLLLSSRSNARDLRGETIAPLLFEHPASVRDEAETLRDILEFRLRDCGYYRVKTQPTVTKSGDRVACNMRECAFKEATKAGAALVLMGTVRRSGSGISMNWRIYDTHQDETAMSGATTVQQDFSDLDSKINDMISLLCHGEGQERDPDLAYPESSFGIVDGVDDRETVLDLREMSISAGDDNGHEWVRIVGGKHMIGSNHSDAENSERPRHHVVLSDFKISKHEVTQAQYGRFLSDTGYEPEGNPGTGLGPSHPVSNVTHRDARAYAEWLSVRTGRTMRLPTEAEWEVAASGADERLYPWGNEHPRGKDETGRPAPANFIEENEIAASTRRPQTRAVGSYPDGASPVGVMDMAGNVAEWVQDYYAEDAYRENREPNPCVCRSEILTERVIRGGAYNTSAEFLRVSARMGVAPDVPQPEIGFRVVQEIDIEALPTITPEKEKKRGFRLFKKKSE